MDYLPYSQEYMLLVSIMGGMFLGFIWDIYRLIRHYIKFGSIGTALGDFVYWILSIYIGVQLIFDLSYGNVRFFILLGFMFGALLYFYGISRYVIKALIFIIDIVLKIVKKVIYLLINPIKQMIKFVQNKINLFIIPIKAKCKKAKNAAKKRYKFFKFRLRKASKNKKLVYNRIYKKEYNKRYIKKKGYISKRKRGQGHIERKSEDNRTQEENKL